MAKVSVYGKDNLDKALRHFRKRCAREGIFSECRERQFYVKPSKKKREKRRKTK